MGAPNTDVAFTPSVKAEQEKRGSRESYRRVEQSGGWRSRVTPELVDVLADVRSFYLGTANADGQPYIQHRGGPAGFLRVLDERTLGFADYGGNRQYITLGNLVDNPRAYIFLMDYGRRQRVKLWGRARVVENDDALLADLSTGANTAPERAILFEVEAWDRNCRQHIPHLLPAGAVEQAMRALQDRIAALEAELQARNGA